MSKIVFDLEALESDPSILFNDGKQSITTMNWSNMSYDVEKIEDKKEYFKRKLKGK